MEKRKAYLYNPDVSIPKTTAWRKHKRLAVSSTTELDSSKRRKIYHRKASVVPKSTLWRWKRRLDTDADGKTDSDESEDSTEIHYESRMGEVEENTEVINNQCSDEYDHDKVDENIISESNEMESSDISEHSDTNGDENCKNGKNMCDNIDSDDDGDEQSESSEGGAVNNEMENNEISGCSEGEDEHDCSDGGASSIEDITDDNECSEVYSDDSEEVDEENNGYQAGVRDQHLLCNNSPVTLEESIVSTYLFSIKNKLSYQATTQLIELLRLHLPQPNQYPHSLHLLRKHFTTMKNLEITKFCSSCMAKLSQEIKRCQNSDCSGASMSHYALLPFEDQLADIYSGL